MANDEQQVPPVPVPPVPISPVAPSAGASSGEVGPILSKAWGLAKANVALFVLGFLVTYLLIIVSAITIVGPILVAMPLIFGFIAVLQKVYKGEPAAVGDIFQGFQKFSKALVLFLLMLVVGLAIGVVAMVLMFIPLLGPIGILALELLVGSALYFTVPMAVLSDVAPMDCLKKSFEFFKANMGQVLVLALVTGLISAVGVLAFGVGILFTAPLGMMMSVIAYNEYYLPKSGSVA